MCIRDRFVDIGVGRDGLVHISEMSETRIDSPSDVVKIGDTITVRVKSCLLYTSDAADERSSVDLGGRRIIKKKKNEELRQSRTTEITTT